MIGVFANVAAVLAGGCCGMLFRKILPKDLGGMLMKMIGMLTLYIGITGLFSGKRIDVLIASMVVGSLIGGLLHLEDRVNRLAEKTTARLTHAAEGESRSSQITEGFVSGSLLFCVGAMTVVGSLQAGLTGDCQTLYTKSVLDFVSAMIFGATLGPGVLLSAVTVMVLQGGIVLLSGLLSPLLSDAVVAEITCVGSLVIVALSLKLLGMKGFKIMDFLPCVFLPLLFCPLFDWLSGLL